MLWQSTCSIPSHGACKLQALSRVTLSLDVTIVVLCRRAFYDKRLAQEVDGEALGDVRSSSSLSARVLTSLICRRTMPGADHDCQNQAAEDGPHCV